MSFHQSSAFLKNKINKLIQILKNTYKNSKFDKLSEIYILVLTLPVILN